jgi:hypothetical protein
MNPQSIKYNKQYRELLSVGNNIYDIPEPTTSSLISKHALKYHFTNNLTMDEKEPFLDYQLDNSPLPKVFIMEVQSIRSSDSEERIIVDNWLEKVTTFSRLYREKANRWFVDVRIDFAKRMDEIDMFINGKPVKKALGYLDFGLQSLKEHYSFHELICEYPNTCSTNRSYEELIDKLESKINILKSKYPEIKEELAGEKGTNNPEFTTARQILAFHYMFEYMNLNRSYINKTDVARFIQFLTGKEANNSKIENTTIYKKWKKILNKEDKQQVQDLEYIKQYFSKLQLFEIVKMIDNDIDSYKS